MTILSISSALSGTKHIGVMQGLVRTPDAESYITDF